MCIRDSLSADTCITIAENPEPLMALDSNLICICRSIAHLLEGVKGQIEQDRHDQGGNYRPKNFEAGIAMNLLWFLGFVFTAAVAKDRIYQETFDNDENNQCHYKHQIK